MEMPCKANFAASMRIDVTEDEDMTGSTVSATKVNGYTMAQSNSL